MKHKKNLLVVTPSIRIAQVHLDEDKYLGTFKLKEIYNIKFIQRLDSIRGHISSDSVIYLARGYYNLSQFSEIEEYYKKRNFKVIK